MNSQKNHWRYLMLGIVLMLSIFTLELSTHLLLGCVGYVLVSFYALWLLRTSRLLIWLGVSATMFLITSTALLIYSQSEIASDFTHLMERGISLFAVWFAIFFTDHYRRLHEEEQASLQQIKAIFENSNEGILFSDANGKILLANPSMEKLLNYNSGELSEKNIRDLMPERYANSHPQFVSSFIETPENKMINRILWAKKKSGEEIPIEINLSHFFRDNTLNIIVFMQDATLKHRQLELNRISLEKARSYNKELAHKVKLRSDELIKSNIELKKSQQLYESMAHNFPDGVIGVLDKNLRYVLADGTGINELGMNSKSAVGARVLDNVNEPATILAEQKLSQVFDGKNVSFDLELQGAYYNIASVPLYSEDNSIPEILVVIKNISERKELEHNLRHTLKKEKDLHVMKSRFVSMASHEFRTPLTTILSSVFLLENYKGEKLQRETGKLLDRIKRAVQSMTEMLNEFLSSGQLEEGKMSVNPIALDLSQFIREIEQEISLLKKDNQVFEFHYDGMMHPVYTDPMILKNILLNLTSNAIKYSKPDGLIKVHTKSNGREFSISVIDQGVGIPEEEQGYIFQRFFRAHNVSGTQGTGLGLNLVKKYMKLLHGHLEFTSMQDKGSTFVVTFPASISNKVMAN